MLIQTMKKLESMLESLDPDKELCDNMQLFVDAAAHVTGSKLGAIGILGPSGKFLSEFVTFGVTKENRKQIGLPPALNGLLGKIVFEKQIINSTTLSNRQDYTGVPPFHPGMSHFLGVPICAGEKPVGMLLAAEKAEAYNEEDEKLLTFIAAQISSMVRFNCSLQTERETRNLLNTIFRYIPIPFAFINRAGEAILLSDTLRKLVKPPAIGNFRFLEVSFARMNMRGADGKPLTMQNHPALRAMRGEYIYKEEFTYANQQNANNPAAISAAPIRGDKGEVTGAVVAIEDRTAEKELEKAREAFAAMIAHDLRNPIHAISLQTQLYMKKIDENHQITASPESLKRILRNTERLARLACDFLDIARLRVGGITLKKVTTDLKNELLQLVDELKLTLENHRMEVSVHGSNFETMIDPVRFHQIMTNLLTNAHKYSQQDQTIEISLSEEKEELVICVQDRGPGLRPEELEHIFDRFYRAASNANKAEGTGLGLYITKGIVESHGGRMWALSDVGVGSRFYVSFPLHSAEILPSENKTSEISSSPEH